MRKIIVHFGGVVAQRPANCWCQTTAHTPAYNFLKFTCNDVIAEWALPVAFGLLAFLGLALAHERSNATKTVTAAREEMAQTVYRGKSANSETRIG